jgi:alkylated DNA repair dioxygenase AlkB
VANTRSFPETPRLTWQPSLLDTLAPEPGFDASFATARRIALDPSAWIEHVPGWVDAPGALFEAIVTAAPWQQHRRHMYDRMVDEPRLTAWHGTGLDDDAIPTVAPAMAAALSARFHRTFDSVGTALYRDGHDSVAWHGDRIDPALVEPVVALVSLGSRRTLRLRSKERRGDSRAFPLAPGDLFVMGGMTQRTWEHSIPKVAKAGPRLSLQFRHSR